MKTRSHKLALFLLYLGVVGLTFFMYNLEDEGEASPWDIISRSDTEAPAEAPVDGNLAYGNMSARRTRKLLVNSINTRTIIKENTDTFAPIMLNQLKMASKHCSSDFAELDSLLSGSDPDRFLTFMHHILGFAAPIGTKERLNTETVRYTFFPAPVKALPDSLQKTRCMTVDLIKQEGGRVENIVSIKGVSSFLIHSSACEEGTAPSL